MQSENFNPLTNSKELLKQFKDRIAEYLPKGTEIVQKGLETIGDVAQKTGERVGNRYHQSRYGTPMYGPKLDREQRGYVQEKRQRDFREIRTADNPLKEAGKKLKENFPAERVIGDPIGNVVLTKQAQFGVNRVLNAYRMASDAGVNASQSVGVENNLSKAAIAAGVPLLYMSLSGQMGSPLDGFRPKGYKAVAPVSKEEDPTGATPRNILEEGALRTFAFQKSQMLPFQEFIKERPDVMPSTIKEYRRYVNRKPEAGKRIDIDPEKQTFTAFGGLIKGTARGLNDPEIRIKGAPITASSVLGIGAGLGTIAAAKKYLDPTGLGVSSEEAVKASGIRSRTTDLETGEISRRQYTVGYTPKAGTVTGRFYQSEPSNQKEGYAVPTEKFQDRLKKQRQQRSAADMDIKTQEGKAANVDRAIGQFMQSGEYVDIPQTRESSKQNVDAAREVKASAQQDIEETVRVAKEYGKPKYSGDTPIPGTAKLNKAGQAFQDAFARRPDLKEPAILLGGTVAALGTAAVAKKLFQKAQEKRIKKEDPVQYEKYKRGDYTR